MYVDNFLNCDFFIITFCYFCDFLLIMHSFISGACVLLCDSFLLLDKGRGLPETGRIKCYCCCCTMEFLLAAMYWLVKL